MKILKDNPQVFQIVPISFMLISFLAFDAMGKSPVMIDVSLNGSDFRLPVKIMLMALLIFQSCVLLMKFLFGRGRKINPYGFLFANGFMLFGVLGWLYAILVKAPGFDPYISNGGHITPWSIAYVSGIFLILAFFLTSLNYMISPKYKLPVKT